MACDRTCVMAAPRSRSDAARMAQCRSPCRQVPRPTMRVQQAMWWIDCDSTDRRTTGRTYSVDEPCPSMPASKAAGRSCRARAWRLRANSSSRRERAVEHQLTSSPPRTVVMSKCVLALPATFAPSIPANCATPRHKAECAISVCMRVTLDCPCAAAAGDANKHSPCMHADAPCPGLAIAPLRSYSRAAGLASHPASRLVQALVYDPRAALDILIRKDALQSSAVNLVGCERAGHHRPYENLRQRISPPADFINTTIS